MDTAITARAPTLVVSPRRRLSAWTVTLWCLGGGIALGMVLPAVYLLVRSMDGPAAEFIHTLWRPVVARYMLNTLGLTAVTTLLRLRSGDGGGLGDRPFGHSGGQRMDGPVESSAGRSLLHRGLCIPGGLRPEYVDRQNLIDAPGIDPPRKLLGRGPAADFPDVPLCHAAGFALNSCGWTPGWSRLPEVLAWKAGRPSSA